MFRGGSKKRSAPSKSRTNSRSESHVNSSRVFVVYGDTDEFAIERKLLWDEVLPELQNFAFHSGFDLEWVDPFQNKGKLNNKLAEQIAENWSDDNNDVILVMLGDKYGTIGPPTEIRKEEFESIRRAVFEVNADVKVLDQCYTLDRTRVHDEYRLNSVADDAKIRSKLIKVVQKGAQAAFEEGTINQVTTERQERFHISPLHMVVNKVLPSDARTSYLLRTFEGVRNDTGSNGSYTEKTEDMSKRISELKNKVSAAAPENSVFSHRISPENGDIGQFIGSKESDKYGDTFVAQVTECLKSQLSQFHSKPSSSVPVGIENIAKQENMMHAEYARVRLKKPWLSRSKHDSKIADMLSSKNGGVYILQGTELSGKTQLLCRLYEQVPDTAHKIIRFFNITHSSFFAHEIWHLICVSLCSLQKQNTKKLQSCFKLNDIMDQFELLIGSLDKPLYLFFDDVHLVKYGHILSAIDRRLQKGPSNLYLFMTTVVGPSIPPIFIVTQTVLFDAISEDEIVEMLKLNLSTTQRKLSSEELSVIKLQLLGKTKQVLLAELLLHQMLQQGNLEINGTIDDCLERLEKQFGLLPFQMIARYLACSSNGLTRLELYDILCSNREVMESVGDEFTFPPVLLDSILEGMGPALTKVLIDNREVFRISHSSLLSILRHRYFESTYDLKSAHNEIADVFADVLQDQEMTSARTTMKYHVFPQATKRDDGSANIRKIRNLWYHLLHTGNMDALKEWTLCNFDYVDCMASNCGVMHLLSVHEECAMQVLHHDLQVLCEQVILPALPTVVRDSEQLAAEVIGRLRYTRGDNSHFLNTMVEQAMSWVDTYNRQPLLVPLTCWIPPPKMKTCRAFMLKDWNAAQTIFTTTHNHQHILVTGNQSSPGLIYMYHIPSQILVTTFKGHTAAVTSLCTSSNGVFFVSTSVDKSVIIWSFSNGEILKNLQPHSQKVTCAILSSDDSLLVTGSADSSAKVINVESGEVIKSFKEHTGSVVSLQLTAQDQFLITGSGDFVVQMWDMSTGLCISKMGGLMAPVCCVAITSNDAFVAVGCEDETLRVYGTVSGQELLELMGHVGKINALVAALDDCQLFAATKSKIYCYDLHNGKILDILDCQQPFPICSLKITTDSFFLLSACGAQIHVWNIQKRAHEQEEIEIEKEGFVTAITMAPDQKVAACGTYNGIVALWDLDICQCNTTVIQSRGVPISCLAYTNNSMYLLSGNSLGNIVILDGSTGFFLRQVNLHTSEIVSIHTMDIERIMSCCKSGMLQSWTLFEDEDAEPSVTQGVVPPMFVPTNGKIVIAHCPNNTKEMKVWGLTEQGFVQKNKLSHNEEITCFAASSNGALVATGSTDQSVKLWQIESGFLTQVLVGHEGSVGCIAMAEDERIVLSGATDHKVIIWNVATGDVIHSLQTSASVTTVTLTADATVACCGMDDGWMETWSTEKGQLISSFNAHRPIRNIVQSFDANRLLVHLTGCAQLPILCLHNTPAGPIELKQRRRSTRTQSISMTANDVQGSSSDSKKEGVSGPSSTTLQARVVAAPKSSHPRPTFETLERSKSRSSLIEKVRSNLFK